MAYREVSLYAIFCVPSVPVLGDWGNKKRKPKFGIALKNRIFVSQTGRLGHGPGIFVYI